MNDLPKCTLCGEPATCMIRDCVREVIENSKYKYTPMNEPEWRYKTHGISTVYEMVKFF